MERSSASPANTEGLPHQAVRPAICLTIAGFDPSSGAGITADLKTFAAFDVYGMAAITALTVQSTQGVRATEAVSPELLRETLVCLADDVTFAAIKIGMLASSGVVAQVVRFLAQVPLAPEFVVLDPVVRSSSGRELLAPDGVAALRRELLPLVGWVTPNLDELALLTDRPLARDSRTVEEQAGRLAELAGQGLGVVATGGHLDEPDDYVFWRSKGVWLKGERVDTGSTHGTGCAFSSALAAGLANGSRPMDAVRGAKQFVTEALRAARPVGMGRGPMHHLYRLDAAEPTFRR